MEIRRTEYLSADAQGLIKAAMVDLNERYNVTEGDETPVDPTEFEPPRGEFFVAYLDGEPVACAGWRTHNAGTAELKRMYTSPAARGRGVARAILAEVERSAREHGMRRMILETGAAQPEAISLYQKAGYERIPDFGYYQNEPDVRSFGKELQL
jgi:GNAT superfamily N-acetyltransferase